MNYKTLSKREESIAENCRCNTYHLSKMALKELYHNLSVFVAELLPENLQLSHHGQTPCTLYLPEVGPFTHTPQRKSVIDHHCA